MLLICIGACHTEKYVPVETVRTEYRDGVREMHVTDSVTNDRFVFVKGDTVLDIRWRDRWHTATVHDTIRFEKSDTIRIPYPVEVSVEVERKRTWWETVLMWSGGFFLLALCAAALWVRWRRMAR